MKSYIMKMYSSVSPKKFFHLVIKNLLLELILSLIPEGAGSGAVPGLDVSSAERSGRRLVGMSESIFSMLRQVKKFIWNGTSDSSESAV